MTVSQDVRPTEPPRARAPHRRARRFAVVSAVLLVLAAAALAGVLALSRGDGGKAPTITMPASIGGVARSTTAAAQATTGREAAKWAARFDAPAEAAAYWLPSGFPTYTLVVVPASLSKLYPDLRTALDKWVAEAPSDFRADVEHATYRTIDGVRYAVVAGYVNGKPVTTITMWDGKGAFGYLTHSLTASSVPAADAEVARTHDILNATVH